MSKYTFHEQSLLAKHHMMRVIASIPARDKNTAGYAGAKYTTLEDIEKAVGIAASKALKKNVAFTYHVSLPSFSKEKIVIKLKTHCSLVCGTEIHEYENTITEVIHTADSNNLLPVKGMTVIQAMGSLQTYLTRYMLLRHFMNTNDGEYDPDLILDARDNSVLPEYRDLDDEDAVPSDKKHLTETKATPIAESKATPIAESKIKQSFDISFNDLDSPKPYQKHQKPKYNEELLERCKKLSFGANNAE